MADHALCGAAEEQVLCAGAAVGADDQQVVAGRERAQDAQARIVREAEVVLERAQIGHVLFVGHGAVGTLLFAHYAGLPISRANDQPPGGGHYFSLIRETRAVVHPWRRIEEAP